LLGDFDVVVERDGRGCCGQRVRGRTIIFLTGSLRHGIARDGAWNQNAKKFPG
jgi:hypothetical protein